MSETYEVRPPFTLDRSITTVSRALRGLPAGDNATQDLVSAFIAACKKTYGGWPPHPPGETRNPAAISRMIIESACRWHCEYQEASLPLGSARSALSNAVRFMVHSQIPYDGATVADPWTACFQNAERIVFGVIAANDCLPEDVLAASTLVQCWTKAEQIFEDQINEGTFELGNLQFDSTDRACVVLLRIAERHTQGNERLSWKDAAMILRTTSWLHYEWGLDKIEPADPLPEDTLSVPEPQTLSQPASERPLEDLSLFGIEDGLDSGKPAPKRKKKSK